MGDDNDSGRGTDDDSPTDDLTEIGEGAADVAGGTADLIDDDDEEDDDGGGGAGDDEDSTADDSREGLETASKVGKADLQLPEYVGLTPQEPR